MEQTVVYDFEGTNMTFTVTGVTLLDKMNGQVRPQHLCLCPGMDSASWANSLLPASVPARQYRLQGVLLERMNDAALTYAILAMPPSASWSPFLC